MDDFQRALRQRRFESCVDLLRKGFLSNTSRWASREHADWARLREGQLKRELRKKAEFHWRDSVQQDDWEGARIAAEALLDLEPDDELRLQRVMEARTKVGMVAEAAAAYGEFVGDHGGESRAVSRRTLELLGRVQMVMESRLAPAVQRTPDGLPGPPLIGRDGERTLLQKTMIRVPKTDLRGILVAGEAGIGKTRLIQEALNGPASDGQKILTAEAAELEKVIPLNPLIEVFRGPDTGGVLRNLDEPWRSVLFGVMPGHFLGDGPIPEAPHIQPGSVPRRLFEAFYQLLLSMVEFGPIILVLEDLQWADETTLSVLEFLMRRWDHGNLQLLVSARTEEIRKNPTLEQFLENLRVHVDAIEIQLKDLEPSAGQALINSLTSEPLHAEDIDRLQSLAGGNPFFLIELTLEFLAGRLGPVVTPEGIVPIPLSIRQVLDRRLSQLSGPAQRVIGALAVFSHPLSLDEITSAAHLTVPDCLAGLDQLHRFRLVHRAGSEVIITHELVRQTVYQGLPDSRRAWLHKQVARKILSTRRQASPNELAVHFHRAGVREEAREYSVQAADLAEASGAIPEALRFLRIAREHAQEPAVVADLVSRMGHLNYLHQNLEEAAPLLELAAQRFRRQDNLPRALRAEVERIDCLAKLGLLPLTETLEELHRVKREARIAGRWGIFTKALDVEVHSLDHQGDRDAVRRVLREARGCSEQGGADARCRARAILALNVYYGSPKEGLSAAREAVKISMATSDVDLKLHALNRLIVVLLYQGRLHTPEGIEAFQSAVPHLAKSGDLILKFFLKLNKAVWHLEAGEHDSARTAFEEARTVIRGTKATDAHAMLHLNQGELELATYDIDAARDQFRRAESFLRASSPKAFSTIINAGLGLCALNSGSLAEAREREASLPEFPTFWSFDPSVVVTFKANMLKRRGDFQGAEELHFDVAENVRGRLVTAWIKLSLERAKLLFRRDTGEAKAVLREILEVARKLGLQERIGMARRLMDSRGSLG